VAKGDFFKNDRHKQAPVIVTKFEVKDLTAQDGRVCFSQAQSDTDTSIEELEELMFAEFLEALARVANTRWPDSRMAFKDKVNLAIECVTGLKKFIKQQQADVLSPKKPRTQHKQKSRRLRNIKQKMLREIGSRK